MLSLYFCFLCVLLRNKSRPCWKCRDLVCEPCIALPHSRITHRTTDVQQFSTYEHPGLSGEDLLGVFLSVLPLSSATFPPFPVEAEICTTQKRLDRIARLPAIELKHLFQKQNVKKKTPIKTENPHAVRINLRRQILNVFCFTCDRLGFVAQTGQFFLMIVV